MKQPHISLAFPCELTNSCLRYYEYVPNPNVQVATLGTHAALLAGGSDLLKPHPFTICLGFVHNKEHFEVGIVNTRGTIRKV